MSAPVCEFFRVMMEYDGWQTGTGICAFGVKSAARE
jgi:hypothetical protein